MFVACALDGVTSIYDGTTFQLVGMVKFPDDADKIRYDARSKSNCRICRGERVEETR